MIIKKPNNTYICLAIEKLDGRNTIVKSDEHNVKFIESKYNTYISGFGGSIIQSGLLAALMIFEANDEKKKIINILFELLNNTKPTAEQISSLGDNFYKTIKDFDDNSIKKLRNELIEMAVALKLAMRCFKQVDNIN